MNALADWRSRIGVPMVSTGKDVTEVLFGANGVMSKGRHQGRRRQHLDLARGISGDRAKLAQHNVSFSQPGIGNAKVIKGGKRTVGIRVRRRLRCVSPYLSAIGQGVSYAGRELSSSAKIGQT